MYIPFNAKQVFGLTAKTLTKRMKNYYQDQRFDETIYLQLLKCFQLRVRLSSAAEFPSACFQAELTQIYQKEEWSLWQLRFFCVINITQKSAPMILTIFHKTLT